MHAQATPAPLSVSRSGVLFVSGCATSLRVERGQLLVRTGQGRNIREGRFSRVSRPRIRRVVIYGKGGFTTWDALEWIDGIGAAFVHLSSDGRVVTTSGDAGPNQPALRRAQVTAAETEIGLEIVRLLIGTKIRGQQSVLLNCFPANTNEASLVEATIDRLEAAQTIKAVLILEAKAASAYWSAWREARLRFARSDEPHVPTHWFSFGERQSPLSTSARSAATPSGAILNYLYALAESEARLALLAVGLDPGLGWAHRDAPYRDSAALDLMESVRPSIDRYLHRLLAERTFGRREFAELPTGQVRLLPSLARSLADAALGFLEHSVGEAAEQVASMLGQTASGVVRTPSRRSRGASGKGRATLGRRTSASASVPHKVASACRACGLVLESPERTYCEDCLPEFMAARTDKLVSAARSTLAVMRASKEDPAKSPAAVAKRVAAVAERKRAARVWEQTNPGPYDPEVFRREILPGLAQLTVPRMMRSTGLSSGYCWKIRRGDRVPHAMYWGTLSALIHANSSG